MRRGLEKGFFPLAPSCGTASTVEKCTVKGKSSWPTEPNLATAIYMSLVLCIAAMFEMKGVYITTFEVCMLGGEPDKKTSLLHNCKELCQVAVLRGK